MAQQQQIGFHDLLNLDGLDLVLKDLEGGGISASEAADLLTPFIGCFKDLAALRTAKVYILCSFARDIKTACLSGAYPSADMKQWVVSTAAGQVWYYTYCWCL